MSKQGIEGLEIEQHGHKLRYLSEQYKLHLSTLTISIKSLLEKTVIEEHKLKIYMLEKIRLGAQQFNRVFWAKRTSGRAQDDDCRQKYGHFDVGGRKLLEDRQY